ncbi:ATP synthase F1 subunit delta, partial [Sneathia sp. DSM 16630]|nr:ATP synthase F1 subunit delta [Sneathia sp. DSM 16630]
YLNIYYEDHDKLIVTGIFAKELSQEQKEKLVRKLEIMKKKKVLLHITIDPEIIAGGIIKIGDEVIDGSIITQIKEIRKRF